MSARQQMIDLLAHALGDERGFGDGERRPGFRREARFAVDCLAAEDWLRSARERDAARKASP